MKGSLILCLIFIVLPYVHGMANLTCVSCPLGSTECRDNCTDLGVACVTLAEVNTLGKSAGGSYKGCIDQKLCRPLTFTLTTATGRHIQSNMACCSTDMCNEGLSLSASTNQSFAIKGCATKNACSLQQNDLVPFGGKIYKLSVKAACTDKDNEIYVFAKRGCGTKQACRNKERTFGIPGLYAEIWKNVTCSHAAK
ncbi:phospholipase A2 inhibitor and Ly6/PLAUR domain-containing protein-like [Protobothrops mucrosquamatus]|uniref:phospholipase A2 inhibitor and Ly6/PLAUR domain-containing protein-like n=1 Tax=Protobothrops mucrosquamatus TaxID=103944 RepID=UPI0010FAEC84|nr:phospholipase A2 inhibitor and Ly6/PLAUR domain-containing protein-like [Protobothrops mucrosquamatus]